MKYEHSAVAAVLLFGVVSVAVYGMGKNPSQMAEELRQQQQREAAKATQLETRADELNYAVSGTDARNAQEKMDGVNSKNIVDAQKVFGQTTLGQLITAAKIAVRSGPAWGRTQDTAVQVNDPKMTAQLEKTRAEAKKARDNEAILDVVATAIEKKVASQKSPEKKVAAVKAPEIKAPEIRAPEKRAEPRPEHDGHNRDARDIGKGDAKEFHGNDRAAEKAGRTG
jgi:hypothetical protein